MRLQKNLKTSMVFLLLLAGCIPIQRVQNLEEPELPRGLVAQESGVEIAVAYGAPMAAKRWPVAQLRELPAELAEAEIAGVQLIVGMVWQNETYTGAPSALPAGWDSVCWTAPNPGCGPNYANPVTRAQALQLIRDLSVSYDGHPQVAAFVLNIGDDGERRFCKKPLTTGPGTCRDAYDDAGLTTATWERFVQDAITTAAASFQQTPVLFHYSGLGYAPREIGRDAQRAVDAGLLLMGSGLYPYNCNGNSMGGVCNPEDPLLNDWQVPGAFPGVPLVLEQSWRYTTDNAALAWLWAVTHGAWQVHAQRETLANSVGTEWRETAEYMLQHPDAALWVARDVDPNRCPTPYCPETGDWSRNVVSASAGAIGFDVSASYMGWVARQGPVELRTTIAGPVEAIVWTAAGERYAWEQPSGERVLYIGEEYVHRIEVRPVEYTGSTLPAVYDCQGDLRSWDWLAAKYPGVRVLRSGAETAFRLVAVRETCAPATVVVRVYGLDGQPSQNYVGLYWPNPEIPISTAGSVNRWYSAVGARQLTSSDGHTGFGLGQGSYIGPEGGPHAAWVLSPSAGSDALDRFGMLGGTDHHGPLSLDFRLMEEGAPAPTATPPPEPTATVTPPPEPTATATPPPEPHKSWRIYGTIGGMIVDIIVEER